MEKTLSHSALSERVKEDIIRLIRNSEGDNNKLPPESTLAKDLGVSVAVVREALLLLSLEGIITKKHGSGNFFHKSMLGKRNQYLGRMPGYLSILRAQGQQPTVSLPYYETRIPPKDVCAKLQIEESEMAFFYSRTIYVDGVPAVYGTNWLPAKLFHHFPGDSESMFNVFDLIYHYMLEEIAYGDAEFIPAVACENDVQQLGIALNSPFMIQNEVYYSLKNKPLAYSSDKLNPAFMHIRIIARP